MTSRGSMDVYKQEMRQALTGFRDALKNSKEADEILVARANFDSEIAVGGIKELKNLIQDLQLVDVRRCMMRWWKEQKN